MTDYLIGSGLKFNNLEKIDPVYVYTCLNLINTDREEEINLGTNYYHPKLNLAECLISEE